MGLIYDKDGVKNEVKNLVYNGQQVNVLKYNENLVYERENFLNIKYENGVITDAYLDYENSNAKKIELVVFAFDKPSARNYRAATISRGRKLINSNFSNVDIQKALKGFNIGDGGM